MTDPEIFPVNSPDENVPEPIGTKREPFRRRINVLFYIYIISFRLILKAMHGI